MKFQGNVDLQIIASLDEYNYFFGYYDLQPYDTKSERHPT